MTTAYRVARDVLKVAGPEAPAYLQGQLSQNVESLPVGSATRSFVLQPTGKVDAWVRVIRPTEEEYLLDLEAGHGDALVARLRRFLLRTKAEVEPLAWSCVAVRAVGPEATGDAGDIAEVLGPGADATEAAGEVATGIGTGELAAPAGWPGAPGYDILGPATEPPAGAGEGSPEEYEALRIVSGVPAMGAELTDSTIPAEVGQWVIDASVDFAKGCFTGQELVARIDSRGGNVPRHLRGLVVSGEEVPPPGAEVRVDGKVVGAVTSSAPSPVPGIEGPVALAYVGRAVEPPATATIAWDGGGATAQAEVRTLPLALG